MMPTCDSGSLQRYFSKILNKCVLFSLFLKEKKCCLKLQNSLVISNEEGVGHVSEFFSVLRWQFQRRSDFVCYQVIHKSGTRGARVAKPHDLNRSRSQSENFVSRAFGVAIQIDQNVDAISVNPIGSFSVARDLRQVDKVLGLASDFWAESRAVIGAQGVAEYFYGGAIMKTWHGLHEMARGVVAEIGRHITDSQPVVKLAREFVRWLVKDVDLKNRKKNYYYYYFANLKKKKKFDMSSTLILLSIKSQKTSLL